MANPRIGECSLVAVPNGIPSELKLGRPFDSLQYYSTLMSTRRYFLCTTAALSLGLASMLHAADGPKHKILFFTKSSGFEHEVISYKKGQPSFAEKVLTDLGAKNHWEFVSSKDGSLFTPEYLQPGTLRGHERIVTTQSGTHGWRTCPGAARAFRYDGAGYEHLADWHVKHRRDGAYVRVRLAPGEAAILACDRPTHD